MSAASLRTRIRTSLATGRTWTLADQALSSASNFLTFVLLAHAMPQRSLGIYALAFTGLYLIGNVQRSLFVEPHYVHALHEPDYRGYTSATALGQLLLALAVASVAAGAAFGAAAVGHADARGVLLAFALTCIPYLVQDFLRGICFTESRFRGVFANDLVSYGGQLALVALLFASGTATPIRALGAVGVSSGCAVALGLWQFRATITPAIRFRAAMRTNWRMGRWLSAGSIASAAANELYVFLSSGILGVAAAGAFRAVQTVLNVNNVVLVALIGRTLPRASEHARDEGDRGLDRFLVRLVTREAIPIYVLSGLILVLASPLLGTLYGSDYRQFASVLRVMSVVSVLSVPFEVLQIGLKARGAAAPSFVISLFSAGMTIGVGIPMLRAYGLDGIAAAMLIDVVLANGIVWTIYRRVRKRPLAPRRPATDEPAHQPRRDDAVHAQ